MSATSSSILKHLDDGFKVSAFFYEFKENNKTFQFNLLK